MRRRILRTGVVSVLAVTGLALQGMPTASAVTSVEPRVMQPRSATDCTGFTPVTSGVCMDIEGSGLYVKYITGYAQGFSSLTNPHVEFTGPHGLIGNVQGWNETWNFYSKEPAGKYCVTLWEQHSNLTGWIDLGTQCETVHA